MLFELIKDKNVALVGPSSFLDNKNMGELIDKNDIVIKINRFQDLLAKDFGSRIDILFYNFYRDIPNETINNYNCKLIVGGHSFSKHPNNTKKLQKSKKIYNKIPHEYYPEEELSLDIKKIINSYCWKTTGFWIICLLFNKINIMKQLNIFGIDFCYNRYNIKYNSRNFPGCHKFDIELRLFKELFQKCKEKKKIIFHDKNFFKYLNK